MNQCKIPQTTSKFPWWLDSSLQQLNASSWSLMMMAGRLYLGAINIHQLIDWPDTVCRKWSRNEGSSQTANYWNLSATYTNLRLPRWSCWKWKLSAICRAPCCHTVPSFMCSQSPFYHNHHFIISSLFSPTHPMLHGQTIISPTSRCSHHHLQGHILGPLQPISSSDTLTSPSVCVCVYLSFFLSFPLCPCLYPLHTNSFNKKELH